MSKRIKTTEEQDIQIIIPQSRDEAVASVRVIVQAQLETERLVAERDKAIAKISEGYHGDIEGHGKVIESRLAGLKVWSKANAAEFGKLKSTTLDGHAVGFRDSRETKPARGWTWKTILEGLLKRPELDRFIRRKQEPNKEQMLAERDDTALLESIGVRIVPKETFFLKPNREGQDAPELTL
jgi:phage host-nuclease inhibitor protein Gam